MYRTHRSYDLMQLIGATIFTIAGTQLNAQCESIKETESPKGSNEILIYSSSSPIFTNNVWIVVRKVCLTNWRSRSNIEHHVTSSMLTLLNSWRFGRNSDVSSYHGLRSGTAESVRHSHYRLHFIRQSYRSPPFSYRYKTRKSSSLL